MPKIASLSADLVANTTKFDADLKKADRTLANSQRQWQGSLKKIDGQFGGLGKSIGGVTAGLFSLKGAFGALLGIAGAGGLAMMAKQAIDTVGGLGELASQLGITTDTLQAFQYAATQVGLSSAEMETSIGRLTRTIGDAAQGEKEAVDAFVALGVGVLDASGKVRSTEDVLRDAADALQRIPDPARRASLAVDLMGRAGQKMLPFLENGAAGIDDLTGRARELGLVFDEDIIASADEASDKLATLSKVMGVQFNAALVELAPLLTGTADALLDVVRATRFLYELMAVPPEMRSIENLNRQINRLYSDLAGWQEKVGDPWHNQGTVQQNIDAIKDELSELIKARSILEGAGSKFDAGTGTGSSNPPATGSTKKSPAEIQTENLTKKIADLQLQVDTFDLSAVDKKIAESLAGVDMSLSGAGEQVTAITTLIRSLNDLETAAAASKAEVESIDALIAELTENDNARKAEGAAITESVRTPLESYTAALEKLRIQLDLGYISQDTFNRKVGELDEELAKATEGSTEFRDIAEDAMSTIWAGLSDAVVEADNLNEALSGVLKTLAKMLANKAFGALADFGLNAIFGTAAVGGPRSGLTLVGERGPELVNLPAGSYVNPAMSSAAMMQPRIAAANMGGPGGVQVVNNITVSGGGSREQNAEQARQIATEVKRAVDAAVDERIAYQQQPGGAFNPGLAF